jgi:uncharacterized protein YndB with AHSA1/START domain
VDELDDLGVEQHGEGQVGERPGGHDRAGARLGPDGLDELHGGGQAGDGGRRRPGGAPAEAVGTVHRPGDLRRRSQGALGPDRHGHVLRPDVEDGEGVARCLGGRRVPVHRTHRHHLDIGAGGQHEEGHGVVDAEVAVVDHPLRHGPILRAVGGGAARGAPSLGSGMAFSLTEQGDAWLASAPVRHSAEGLVGADPQAVFATLADSAAWPEWFQGMTKVAPDGDGTGVGATRTVWLGPVRAVERFTTWEPGARFGFCVTEANAPGLKSLVELFDLTPAAGGATTVRYTIGAQAAAVPALLDPGLRLFVRRIVSGGLKGLADRHR